MKRLEDIIKSKIKSAGPMTFERFIDFALYHKEFGYYSSGNVSIGGEGDFYTSPYVHSAFGEVISKFLLKSLSFISAPVPTIVELGAGKGILACDILDTIKRKNVAIYDKLIYTYIEKSPALIEQAHKALSEHKEKIRFIQDITEIENDSLEGIVISNELFDSIPFHRVIVENSGLREVYVSLKDDNLIETSGALSTEELKKYIDKYELELIEGQQMEICLAAGKALKEIYRILRKGFILTIDYGYTASDLYSPSRINGTYKCMKGHTINENPYQDIGEQDITAHVDFSNLISEGEAVGLNKLVYTTQGQFLLDWGILDVVEKMSQAGDESTQKKVAAVKNLFLPGSMGNSFKVLIQEKNLGKIAEGFYPESPFKISFDVA